MFKIINGLQVYIPTIERMFPRAERETFFPREDASKRYWLADVRRQRKAPKGATFPSLREQDTLLANSPSIIKGADEVNNKPGSAFGPLDASRDIDVYDHKGRHFTTLTRAEMARVQRELDAA